MPALSQSLSFFVENTNTVYVSYPNTATDVMTYFSDKEKGDGYFGSSDGVHTVMYTATQDFSGSISMQGSLATDPSSADWFTISSTTVTYSELDSRNSSTVDYFNFTGNFVWVRGAVSIRAGTVESIQYNR